METIKDFDQILLELRQRIEAKPEDKYRLLLRAILESRCPYLQKKIKAFYKN